MSDREYHIPVLLHESIQGLNINPNGIYVDATFGGGGHSSEILKQLENGRLIAFDQDPDAAENLPKDDKLTFIPQNFGYIKRFLRLEGIRKVDGILADFGVSSHQFDQTERGFSIRGNAPLDMRMNQSGELTAAKILQEYTEEKLVEVLRSYGEIQRAHAVARKIAQVRESKGPILEVEQLNNVLRPFAQRGKENKFLAQVYQALRIEVNGEMEVLKELLAQSVALLPPGGRLVCISYHSLEDRLVKNFMKSGAFDGEIKKDFFGNQLKPFKALKSKPIVPTELEIENNNRARSAKLRIAERTTWETE